MRGYVIRFKGEHSGLQVGAFASAEAAEAVRLKICEIFAEEWDAYSEDSIALKGVNKVKFVENLDNSEVIHNVEKESIES